MNGIQFVTGGKGHKVAVQLDLKNMWSFGKILRMCLSRGRGGMKNVFRSKR